MGRYVKGSAICLFWYEYLTVMRERFKIQERSEKFKTAYFGWIKFMMDSDKVTELKKRLDLDSNFVRFLILKTVKENTINEKRFPRGNIAHRKIKTDRNKNNETIIPINKEEIDKEIDALVAN